MKLHFVQMSAVWDRSGATEALPNRGFCPKPDIVSQAVLFQCGNLCKTLHGSSDEAARVHYGHRSDSGVAIRCEGAARREKKAHWRIDSAEVSPKSRHIDLAQTPEV